MAKAKTCVVCGAPRPQDLQASTYCNDAKLGSFAFCNTHTLAEARAAAARLRAV